MPRLKQTKYRRGATLLEVLVGVAIFSLVIGVATGLLISSLRAQKSALAQQELLDQTSFAFEYMSRALRMARKEISAPACLANNGLNYELTRAGSGVRFINYQGLCDEFFLEDSALKEKKADYVTALPITSARLSVVSFNVVLSGQSESDDVQPLATIFLKVRAGGFSGTAREIKMQTSISQRNLDM